MLNIAYNARYTYSTYIHTLRVRILKLEKAQARRLYDIENVLGRRIVCFLDSLVFLEKPAERVSGTRTDYAKGSSFS